MDKKTSGLTGGDHIFVAYGMVEICSFSCYIYAGADVNLPDKDGVTSLAHAKNKRFTGINKILEKEIRKHGKECASFSAAGGFITHIIIKQTDGIGNNNPPLFKTIRFGLE